MEIGTAPGRDADAAPLEIAPAAPLPRSETGVPPRWDDLWGDPVGPAPLQWHRIKKLSRELAEDVPLVDRTEVFEALVGSGELRVEPVHRWFAYKESYSPRLLSAVLGALPDMEGIKVLDTFGGVATTALAGQLRNDVAEVRSVEFSPLAQFVGSVKLRWPELSPARLRALLPEALDYTLHYDIPAPTLAAYSNPEIFHPATVAALVSAREHIRALNGASSTERDIFLVGLAAIVEDLSGAMKDGRALRIKRDRKRRPSSLAATRPTIKRNVGGRVKRALAGQWTAMIQDVEHLTPHVPGARSTVARHLRGDARDLGSVRHPNGKPAIPAGWADIACFSPPYLNFIDYTEVHKLELWLLEHATSQQSFSELRRGTLRSHPSIKFDERTYFDGVQGPARDLVDLLADWMCDRAARREVGPIVRQYFEDMLQVWREQHRAIRTGGIAVCVVANSTFSRRERAEARARELWRLPVLTDVILAHLAREAGFDEIELWQARELQPRNVRSAHARESLVVARKR